MSHVLHPSVMVVLTKFVCLHPLPFVSQDYALAIAELQQCTKMKPALLAPLLKYLGRLNLAVSHSQQIVSVMCQKLPAVLRRLFNGADSLVIWDALSCEHSTIQYLSNQTGNLCNLLTQLLWAGGCTVEV